MQPTENTVTNVVIESELWRVSLEPHAGLQTRYCKIQHGGNWLDLMPDCSANGEILSSSNFHMLPYSNRIKDARFKYSGRDYSLKHADKHAIHGALRKLPWRVTAQTELSVSAEYDSLTDGEINWPWPISAHISYQIDENTLVTRMRLTNNGSSPMPAGMGWHPYFCRTISGASPELKLPATGYYPDTDGDCLPVGEPVALSDELNFNEMKALNPGQLIDHCLAGFRSPASLRWREAGITLHIHASANCTHAVLYNPAQPFFAVEPVTNANDGFNLHARGIDAGVKDIAPGEKLEAEMRLELVLA